MHGTPRFYRGSFINLALIRIQKQSVNRWDFTANKHFYESNFTNIFFLGIYATLLNVQSFSERMNKRLIGRAVPNSGSTMIRNCDITSTNNKYACLIIVFAYPTFINLFSRMFIPTWKDHNACLQPRDYFEICRFSSVSHPMGTNLVASSLETYNPDLWFRRVNKLFCSRISLFGLALFVAIYIFLRSCSTYTSLELLHYKVVGSRAIHRFRCC